MMDPETAPIGVEHTLEEEFLVHEFIVGASLGYNDGDDPNDTDIMSPYIILTVSGHPRNDESKQDKFTLVFQGMDATFLARYIAQGVETFPEPVRNRLSDQIAVREALRHEHPDN